MNIKLNIKNEGFKKFDQNFFNLDRDTINHNFEKDFNEKKYRNNNYPNVAILNFNDLKTKIYFDILKKINLLLKKNDLTYEFDALWLQNSNKYFSDSNTNELPFIPHIDKRRALKVMIYLNEINKDVGPINLTHTAPEKFEKLRKNLDHNYQINKQNVINSIPLNKFISCEGNFGTCIIFDTNTPHFAGPIVEKNITRKILRFSFIKRKNLIHKFYYFVKKNLTLYKKK
jgi:hypothetical protein